MCLAPGAEEEHVERTDDGDWGEERVPRGRLVHLVLRVFRQKSLINSIVERYFLVLLFPIDQSVRLTHGTI